MLVVFTIVSVVAAVTLGLWAWRLTLEERRRSDARISALIASLAEADAGEQGSDPSAPMAPGSDPIEAPTEPPGVGGTLFETNSDAGGRRRLALAGLAGVGLVAIVLVGGLAIGWTTGAGRPDATTVSSEAGQPLELLSLTASRNGAELSIAGLVRNPPTGAPLDRVAAVILFFDSAGGFLISARAPLDRPVLAPGEACPFHITVAAPESTSRYRVSFRAAENAIVSHVDRRPMSTEPHHTAPEPPAVRRVGL